MAVDWVGVDVHVIFGDSTLIRGRIIRLIASWSRFTHMQYSITVCSRLEAASDVISGWFMMLAVPDNRVQFRDPRLNRSGEIRAPHFVTGERTHDAGR